METSPDSESGRPHKAMKDRTLSCVLIRLGSANWQKPNLKRTRRSFFFFKRNDREGIKPEEPLQGLP